MSIGAPEPVVVTQDASGIASVSIAHLSASFVPRDEGVIGIFNSFQRSSCGSGVHPFPVIGIADQEADDRQGRRDEADYGPGGHAWVGLLLKTDQMAAEIATTAAVMSPTAPELIQPLPTA